MKRIRRIWRVFQPTVSSSSIFYSSTHARILERCPCPSVLGHSSGVDILGTQCLNTTPFWAGVQALVLGYQMWKYSLTNLKNINLYLCLFSWVCFLSVRAVEASSRLSHALVDSQLVQTPVSLQEKGRSFQLLFFENFCSLFVPCYTLL